MSQEELKQFNSLNLADSTPMNQSIDSKSESLLSEKTAIQPSNQLESGLLGWYATCSSRAVKRDELYLFSMYNEPLILYRDKDLNVKCIKDMCPHRGASFTGGQIKEGELICPYHGARFSSKGECTNCLLYTSPSPRD